MWLLPASALRPFPGWVPTLSFLSLAPSIRPAGSPASFSSLLEALQRQSAHGVPLDEQAILELKREQLLQQYSGMGPVPGSAAGAGDRNQWYNMNLAGGGTFGAGPLEQPPPLPPQAGVAGQAAAAEQPPQVLRPKPLQASAALSGGTPQNAGQEQPVTSRSPLAGGFCVRHVCTGGCRAALQCRVAHGCGEQAAARRVLPLCSSLTRPLPSALS